MLRQWCDEDIEPFAHICADPDVMAFIGDGSTRTADEVSEQVTRFEAAWKRSGYGLFAIELRGSCQFLGFSGFADPVFMPELLPSVEIGWRLGKPYWGKGYATEAAEAALAAGIRSEAFADVLSICQVGNSASVGIMQKIGLKFDRRGTDPTCGREVLIYRLPRSS